MRPIKFRLWNDHAKIFHYDVENVYECLKQQLVYDKKQDSRGSTPAYNHKADGAVWNQFTGSHDKNGKEIYEGDIMQIGDITTAITIYKEIAWSETRGGYCFKWKGKEIYNLTKERALEQKIIGNIYENPELLK